MFSLIFTSVPEETPTEETPTEETPAENSGIAGEGSAYNEGRETGDSPNHSGANQMYNPALHTTIGYANNSHLTTPENVSGWTISISIIIILILLAIVLGLVGYKNIIPMIRK